MVTKEAIKQAAFALFAEKGYEATSTQDIAEAVGLKKQSLYSHFKSKNEIFMELLHDQSAIILSDLMNSIENNKNNSAEVFLQKIFETLIQTFSLRYRLLLIKRIILLYASRHKYSFIEEFFMKFTETIRTSLQAILMDQNHLFEDESKYISFYSYFMLNVHGYMDIMLTAEVDEAFQQGVWDKLWKGISSYFN